MSTLSGFKYQGMIYLTTHHTSDRVEGHVLLSTIDAGQHIRYRGRIIMRMENGYRYEYRPGSFSRLCKKAITALLNVERTTSPHARMDKSLSLDLGKTPAVPTKTAIPDPDLPCPSRKCARNRGTGSTHARTHDSPLPHR